LKKNIRLIYVQYTIIFKDLENHKLNIFIDISYYTICGRMGKAYSFEQFNHKNDFQIHLSNSRYVLK